MKIKLTKGELKKQRDALAQYQRYLPTLQLKKQQLQLEILEQQNLLGKKKAEEAVKIKSAESWSGLLAEPGIDMKPYLQPKELNIGTKNIAGIDLPVFSGVEFPPAEYDLFLMPLWVDAAVEALRSIVSLRKEMEIIVRGIEVLRRELRITTQRVNLFEKIKIPQAEENIRSIKIYIGDQMVNAVGRSKIAKKKIEAQAQEEALV